MPVLLLSFIPLLRGGGQSLLKNPALQNLREEIVKGVPWETNREVFSTLQVLC